MLNHHVATIPSGVKAQNMSRNSSGIKNNRTQTRFSLQVLPLHDSVDILILVTDK